MMKKFCFVLIAIFTLGIFVIACDAGTAKKAEPTKQEEVKKAEPQTIKVDPQMQYVVVRSDNGGWLVNVMVGQQRVGTYVFDNKSFNEFWQKQLNPTKEESKPVEKK